MEVAMDLLKRCRLCLNTCSNATSIFEDGLPDMIFQLTELKMNDNDLLPKFVCPCCALEVQQAICLRQRILESHMQLLDEIKKKIEIKVDNPATSPGEPERAVSMNTPNIFDFVPQPASTQANVVLQNAKQTEKLSTEVKARRSEKFKQIQSLLQFRHNRTKEIQTNLNQDNEREETDEALNEVSNTDLIDDNMETTCEVNFGHQDGERDETTNAVNENPSFVTLSNIFSTKDNPGGYMDTTCEVNIGNQDSERNETTNAVSEDRSFVTLSNIFSSKDNPDGNMDTTCEVNLGNQDDENNETTDTLNDESSSANISNVLSAKDNLDCFYNMDISCEGEEDGTISNDVQWVTETENSLVGRNGSECTNVSKIKKEMDCTVEEPVVELVDITKFFDKHDMICKEDGVYCCIKTEEVEIKTEEDRTSLIWDGGNHSGDHPRRDRNISGKKQLRCKFCERDVNSKNFARHLDRSHQDEKEIKNILQLPKGSSHRKEALNLLRKSINFDLYINGVVRPFRQTKEDFNSQAIYPCVYCKGLFKREYLRRHTRNCNMRNGTDRKKNAVLRTNYVSNSQTLIACALDSTNVISKLNVKEQVFDCMKGDDISFQAKKDLLIVYFGELYLKNHKRERNEHSCSNKMRELARLLIAYREIVGNQSIEFKDILKPKNLDYVFSATRTISGYDPENNKFQVPSLALHIGTYLKDICDVLTYLILKETPGFQCKSKTDSELWLQDIREFRDLVGGLWNTKISSLAIKDLQEKRRNKPVLVPLVGDIKIFRDETLIIAKDCHQKFVTNVDDIETYKLLAKCSLALLIMFNRRTIGDVQSLKVTDFLRKSNSALPDFECPLTESEKILTKKCRIVVNSENELRQVVIFIPELLDKYVNTLLEHREKYVTPENEYVFSVPESRFKWVQGDVAIRFLASKMKLKHPDTISSNKWRKQIATVSQILNLNKADMTQLSKVMGIEFNELPLDINQTAKLLKLILLMEKGMLPDEHKKKALSEMKFNENLENPEENNDELLLAFDAPVIDNSMDCSASSLTNTDGVGNIFEDFSSTMEKSANKTKIQKRGWTRDELHIIKENFEKYIQKRYYPSTACLLNFIKERNFKRTPAQIKAKIQHLIKLTETM